MSDYVIQVLAGLTVLIIAGVATATWLRGRGWLKRAGLLSRLRVWIADNVVYARRGFRWEAALEYHHDTLMATVQIGKKLPAGPTDPNVAVRPRTFKSRRFASADDFAREVYASSIEACFWDGWPILQMHFPQRPVATIRLMSGIPSALVQQGVDPHTIDVRRCIIIDRYDWYPFAKVPNHRDSRYTKPKKSSQPELFGINIIEK